MIDYYGQDADYIHIKFGRMQKMFHFTKEFEEKYPRFCEEYRKYWINDGEVFRTPLDIAQYVDAYNVPVHFYYNYTDEPSKDITDVYEYILREFSFGEFKDGEFVGLDGEKETRKEYKVTRVEE